MNAPTENPDAWAVCAATLPLAFAQVREDPRLDMELAAALPSGATVVMIASGGDTAVCLGRLPLKNIHLVDMNPAQLALTRCKWHLASHVTADEAAALLGHLPMESDARRNQLRQLFESLQLQEDVFGPLDFVAEQGPDQAGRYERTFAALRDLLSPHRPALEAVLNAGSLEATAVLMDRDGPFGVALDDAFAQIMSQSNLVCLFGKEATQHPRRTFHEHFAWRTREALTAMPAHTNPFLWQIFAGHFATGYRYDWLQADAGCGQPLRAEPIWHHGKMSEVLQAMPERSVDLVQLSNILDWLAPEEAAATLRSAHRVLKDGGRVILRQLNSSLDMESLPSDFLWDHDLGVSMQTRDRSFFYPRIFVGTRA